MKILLDTKVLLWCFEGDERIPLDIEFMILDPHNAIYVSTAALWEISIKHKKHPKQLHIDCSKTRDYIEQAGFIPLDVNAEHVSALDTLELDPKVTDHQDPFDRIMIAQAKTEHMAFITSDKRLQYYHEKFIKVI